MILTPDETPVALDTSLPDDSLSFHTHASSLTRELISTTGTQARLLSDGRLEEPSRNYTMITDESSELKNMLSLLQEKSELREKVIRDQEM